MEKLNVKEYTEKLETASNDEERKVILLEIIDHNTVSDIPKEVYDIMKTYMKLVKELHEDIISQDN